ncbi:helix-turn-helix transcriptional regulator [Pseudomonas sp. ABC1]|uniref:LuxR C-terminal-related transcriptional regulator n=1 Tax=Pseudomonas sp. ABC1 TaxID=2748080 RepID=UPI0015C3F150|nr:LuxR C-terminal-related transcriptional regulator [Pseudomonas sp. ABC1]QLF92580.1 helix-turn-helix transcriptional regulator [Pseudomonas sp. ABC1]
MSVRFDPHAASAKTDVALPLPARMPRLPPAHISRCRLSEQLLASDCRLRLLCAPAGFGKSVLINECVRQKPADTQVLWLDIGGRDCSPDELLARLCACLGRDPEPGLAPEAALIHLLERVARPLWIVLDDYPRAPSAALDACIDRLLDVSNESVRWWVSSRRQPPWKLSRLVLQGDLHDLQAEALALDAEELQQLLQAHRVAIAEPLVQQLLHGSEGWPAGVCLMLLGADEQALRERLVAGTPLLRDYVQREILDEQDEDVRQALISLAAMPRFSEPLCQYLFEGQRTDLFEQLRSRQLFIRPIDSCGEWFRLWRPLAMLLPLMSGQVSTPVHIRACQWFAGRGNMRDAVEHALKAGQPDVAANFLQRYGQEQLLIDDNVSYFLKWRAEMPQDLFGSTTRLIILHGWALILSARLDEAEACLLELGRFFPQPDARRQRQLLAHWQALNGYLARLRGEPQAREHCLQAMDALPEHAWAQRVLCCQVLTQQAMAEGQGELAQQYNNQGMRLARLNGSALYEAMLSIDRIQLLELNGELDRAVSVLDDSLDELRGQFRHSPIIGRLQLLKGHLLACLGEDDAAFAAYQQGRLETELCADAYAFFGYVGLAELAARRQLFASAHQWLHEAERLSQWRHVPESRFRGIFQLVSGLACLHRGELERARNVFQQITALYAEGRYLSPSGFYELLPRVRRYQALIELLEGRAEAAISQLQALVDEHVQRQNPLLVCECRFTLAEALLGVGRSAEAERMLRQALDDAARQKLVKPLYELQHRQPQWLAKALPGDESLRERLLSLASHESAPLSPGEPLLSGRELMVLRLIAQGCSNQEIAETLFISLHTVKTHARRINSKLGISRRTQAVAQAKARGWL